MEEAIARRSLAPTCIAPTSSLSSDYASALLSFAEALRQFQPIKATAATTPTPLSSEEKDTDVASWLYKKCQSLPGNTATLLGGPLQLSQQIVRTCHDSANNDLQLQEDLFHLLGTGGENAEETTTATMEFLMELVPLAQRVGKIGFQDLQRVASPEERERGAGATHRDTRAAQQQQEVQKQDQLRREALHAINEAAAAKLQAESITHPLPGAAGASAPTHHVTRKSDKEVLRQAKKATKRAAEAVTAAREGGVYIPPDLWPYSSDNKNNDNNTYSYNNQTLLEESTLASQPRGLQGMSHQDLEAMQQALLPEGTKLYTPGFASQSGRLGLPPGAFREYFDGYEMVTVPPPPPDTMKKLKSSRIDLDSVMGGSVRKCFAGTESLNPMQSQVFQGAFHSSENLLICAPTGAGKTNVAMLTIAAHFRDCGYLHNEIHFTKRTKKNHNSRDNSASAAAAAAYFGGGTKVVYIAPMKALAQEVVEKFSSKLSPLHLVVRELTGDMQLTRAEAEAADILVTTPEKWDVVTRKGGTDGSLAQACGLLIIDEVHLLADERGAVLEAVVSRVHRHVESSQRQVRLVGLSATLPNYHDVASFLKVDASRGLFYFGPEHRPVPLQQQFVGVRDDFKKDRFARERKMNDVCYNVVADSLRRGYQVMVFVHSRKGTGMTAEALADLASKKNQLENLFLTIGTEENGEAHNKYAEKVQKSRNREVALHFDNGMGIHHAGMLRPDRKLTEQMFADGAIKVLCCTATLAWGINLPAHTVVIKGTEVYNPEKGGNVDLSILDVQQIFGRAGRPQFDSSGEATLITSHDALARYLDKLIRQVPIESGFIKQLADHLNAEIVGGTVTNVREAALWLTYTYLYVRMCKNPLGYGISADQKEDDPTLRRRCTELIEEKATYLDELHMIKYSAETGNMSAADLGRVASQYYVQAESVATFNEKLSRNVELSDADLCHLICCAHEFENVKVRQEELQEMDQLKEKSCPLAVDVPVEEFSGKCCVLLQAYVSQAKVTSFTLISDTNYVASNAGRVARALFEMCLRKGDAGSAVKLLRLAKSVDQRLWWFQTPLRQFANELPRNVFNAIESFVTDPRNRRTKEKIQYSEDNATDSYEAALSLLDMQPQEVGQICRANRLGEKIQKLIAFLPRLEVDCDVLPITRSLLRFSVTVTPIFNWDGRYHGGAMGFWIWVEDNDGRRVYHHEYMLFSRRTHPTPLHLDMSIPAFDPLPPQYHLRIVSDSWVGSEMVMPVSFRDVMLPEREIPYTDLMDLTPLPVTALHHEPFEEIYASRKFDAFNPVQTQLFHLLYHSDIPVLLGAPTGSGKTVVAELALMRLKRTKPQAKCVYIAPLKSLARERLKEWRGRFGKPPLSWTVLEMTGDTHHGARALDRADILICTPEKWDLVTRTWRGSEGSATAGGKKFVTDVGLLIIDEIHLLGEDRGSVLEAIVSRTRYISQFVNKKEEEKDAPESTRIMGLSTALANPKDLADWMGISVEGPTPGSKKSVSAIKGLYNFRPQVRPVPISAHIQGYAGRHYCPRMATMNKPCYAAIKEHSPTKPVIIFVSSRRQTRLTALDLVSYAAGDDDPRAFLGCDDAYMDAICDSITDASLRHTLSFGVGLHHAGLPSKDREVAEELFLKGHIQVLVSTATLAWGVNLPAHLVIVKGTEYFDGASSRYVDYPVTDVLQMMGRAGRPQFDDKGVAVIMVAEGKKNFYKKFLFEPFPVESCLRDKLLENLSAEIASGTIKSVGDAVGYLSWTYFARRVKMNPSYYGAKSGRDEDVEKFFLKVVHDSLTALETQGCVDLNREDTGLKPDDWIVRPTTLGNTSSSYYLDHRSPKQMRAGAREVLRLISQLHDPDEKKAGKEGHQALDPNLEAAAVTQIFLALCFTHEFDEIPVRHNEEELNEKLANSLPWIPGIRTALQHRFHASLATNGNNDASSSDSTKSKKDKADPLADDLMADPHTKSFLLVQAYLANAKLPISDYINDTKGVLDQLPRLLAAMESLMENGASSVSRSFDLACLFCSCRQALSVKLLPDVDALAQIPGITAKAKDKQKSGKNTNAVTLRELCTMDRSQALAAVKRLRSEENRGGRIVNYGGKNVRPEDSVAFLESIPIISIEETPLVTHEVNKSSGKSVGTLVFDLQVRFGTGNKAGGKKRGGHSGGKRSDGEDSSGGSFVAMLGTLEGKSLLGKKNIFVSANGEKTPAVADEKGKSHPTRGQRMVATRNVKLVFDWAAANAGGGCDGGRMILRVLCEDVKGVDLEMLVPLR